MTGIEASAPQLSFWQGSNQVLATFDVSGPSPNPTGSFTPVAPLFLSAGQLYFISCQNSNFSGQVFVTAWALPGTSSPSPYGPEPFSTSSYISQFASYYISPDKEWSSTRTPPSSNSDYLFYGPNFQFQVVPEPMSFELLIFGFLFCLHKLKPRPNFKLTH